MKPVMPEGHAKNKTTSQPGEPRKLRKLAESSTPAKGPVFGKKPTPPRRNLREIPETPKQPKGRQKPAPLTKEEILHAQINGFPLDPLRVLATFATPKNWTKVKGGTATDGYKSPAGDWAYIGPCLPPYQLAQAGLNQFPG